MCFGSLPSVFWNGLDAIRAIGFGLLTVTAEFFNSLPALPAAYADDRRRDEGAAGCPAGWSEGAAGHGREGRSLFEKHHRGKKAERHNAARVGGERGPCLDPGPHSMQQTSCQRRQ